MTFPGFSEDNTNATHIPDQFFRHVLLEIDNLDELKITLYIFWCIEHFEGLFHYLTMNDILNDKRLVKEMGGNIKFARKTILEALTNATKRGTLLLAENPLKKKNNQIILLTVK